MPQLKRVMAKDFDMLLRRPTGAITVVCITVWVDPEKPLIVAASQWPALWEPTSCTFATIRAACPLLAQSGHALVRCTCLLLMLWTAPPLRHQECYRVRCVKRERTSR